MSIEKSVGLNTDEIRRQWRLGDIVLRNGPDYYICMKLIEAEFEDI
jgi:intein-encoded DNA endonuclease-like protein